MKDNDVRILFGERRRLCPYCQQMIGTASGRFIDHDWKLKEATGGYTVLKCKGSGKRPEKANA